MFNHAGAGHQLKINKAAAASTASLLFQDAFSGRAEVGLAGDDDLHVKVSGDGTTWKEALLVNRSTGVVTFPFTTFGGGGGVNPSLAVNGDFQINQRAFAGGALAAGSYGHDRWKAAAGGANYSVSGYVLTLASGTIEQIIETAFWGFASLASTAITVSVDTPSADLTVTVGTVAGTITAGSGRRSVTITTAAGDSGNLPVKIARASAGSVTFGRVKVEIGSATTAWVARTGQDERDLCRYYYQRLQATGANQGLGQCLAFSSDSGFGIFSFLPTPMRGTPAVTSSAFGTFRLTKADGSAYATCTAGTMTWSLTFGYVLSLTGGLTAAGAGLTPGGICWVVSLNATTFIACDAEL